VFRPVESGPEKDSAVTNVVISSAARTAIGSYGKSLKDIPPTDLGATAAVASSTPSPPTCTWRASSA
jgi:hypothetical protein